MKPNAQLRGVEESGVKEEGSFGISLKDSAHIMTILRDTLYSDKILAVLREYASNAWDANREAGKEKTPIKVTLPTMEDLTLTIEDSGLGLSNEDVFAVYSQYGASTKRGSDKVVGMLGIGSKSGFAYSDTFTITSRHGGEERIYAALIDDSEKGVIKLLNSSPLKEGQGTGVSIQIPVKPEDLQDFRNKSCQLFQHFEPRPEINIDLPDEVKDRTKLKHGWLHNGDTRWWAVMGCVSYRVDMEQFKDKIAGFIYKVGGLMKFEIGEVEINASREGLKYSETTKKVIIEKVTALGDEFVLSTIADIKNEKLTEWEKRLRAQVLRVMGFPVPKAIDDLTKSYIVINQDPNSKWLIHKRSSKSEPVSRIQVSEDSRILVVDNTRRSLKGYTNLGWHDYLISSKDPKDYSVEDLQKDLPGIIKSLSLEGIKTGLLSNEYWFSRQREYNNNKKHNKKLFVLKKDHAYFGHPYSRCWDIQEREPSDDDVFVIIRAFKSVNHHNFFYQVQKDRQVAKDFGVVVPDIYGYKDTDKAPVDLKSVKGIQYRDWRKKLYEEIGKKCEGQLNAYEWAYAFESARGWEFPKAATLMEFLIAELGTKHPLTVVFQKHRDAAKEMAELGRKETYLNSLSEVHRNVRANIDENLSAAEKEVDELLRGYPLLLEGEYNRYYKNTIIKKFSNRFLDCGHAVRDGTINFSREWIRYIKMIDEQNKKAGKKKSS